MYLTDYSLIVLSFFDPFFLVADEASRLSCCVCLTAKHSTVSIQSLHQVVAFSTLVTGKGQARQYLSSLLT